MIQIFGVLMGLLGACATGPRESTMKKPGPMAPHVKKDFVRGTELGAPEALRTWLEGHAGALLRVPVQVKRGELGVARRSLLGALGVKLDDSALGVSLDDRLRQACGDSGCTVWLEATWDSGELRVFHFDRAVGADEVANYIEVQR